MDVARARRQWANSLPNWTTPPDGPIGSAYAHGWRQGFVEGAREAFLKGPELLQDKRLHRVMQTSDAELHDPQRAFHTLQGKWSGEDCFIVCGGTSLKDFCWPCLDEVNLIAVNRVALHGGSWPDYLLVNDLHQLKAYEKYFDGRKVDWVKRDSSTIMVSQPTAFFEYKIPKGIWYYPVNDIEKLLLEPDSCFMHTTVAAAAVYMAWTMGAQRIFLLGFDCYVEEKAAYFWGEPSPNTERDPVPGQEGKFIEPRMRCWRKDMQRLKDYFDSHKYYACEWPGPGVYNLSPHNQSCVWPIVDAEEVFQ